MRQMISKQEKEGAVLKYFQDCMEERWGNHKLDLERRATLGLREEIKREYGRDIEEVYSRIQILLEKDSLGDELSEVMNNLFGTPIFDRFVLYCLVEDIDIRYAILKYLDHEMLVFFHQIMMVWVPKGYDNFGKASVVCKTVDTVGKLFRHYRLVDEAYSAYKQNGTPKSIQELRSGCTSVQGDTVGNKDITEVTFDYGILGWKVILKQIKSEAGVFLDLDVTVGDKGTFDAVDDRWLNEFSSTMMKFLKNACRSEFFRSLRPASLIIRHKGEKKGPYHIDLLPRYDSALDKKIKKLANSYGVAKEDRVDIRQEADFALFRGAIEADSQKGDVSVYIWMTALRAIQHEFEKMSTKVEQAERIKAGGPERILKSKLEKSGGELNKNLIRKEGEEQSTTLLDIIAGDDGRDSIENKTILQQIIQRLPKDEIDESIISGLYQDKTQRKIADQLEISEAAVSKRVKKITERGREVLSGREDG